MENKRAKYRAVFNTPMGLEVLTDILNECSLGQTLDADNPHQIGAYNVGAYILAMLGAFESSEVLLKTVQALINVIPDEPEKDEGKNEFIKLD